MFWVFFVHTLEDNGNPKCLESKIAQNIFSDFPHRVRVSKPWKNFQVHKNILIKADPLLDIGLPQSALRLYNTIFNYTVKNIVGLT